MLYLPSHGYTFPYYTPDAIRLTEVDDCHFARKVCVRYSNENPHLAKLKI